MGQPARPAIWWAEVASEFSSWRRQLVVTETWVNAIVVITENLSYIGCPLLHMSFQVIVGTLSRIMYKWWPHVTCWLSHIIKISHLTFGTILQFSTCVWAPDSVDPDPCQHPCYSWRESPLSHIYADPDTHLDHDLKQDHDLNTLGHQIYGSWYNSEVHNLNSSDPSDYSPSDQDHDISIYIVIANDIKSMQQFWSE